MKIKEISASLSGVIPIASYENLRPAYNITAEVDANEDVDACFSHLKGVLRQHFEQEVNRAKTDLISKQYANIRFYEVGGKNYPSVTSILGWNIDWKISEDELQQYASRGTIIHKLIELYLKEKKWHDPIDIPELETDVGILMSGSLNLTWKTCSYQKALENIIDDIEVIATEKVVYNEANLYAGTLDLLYKRKSTSKLGIGDYKTGNGNMPQLAGYSACLPNIEELMVVPVGVSDNKCGFKKPIICNDIQKEFKKFLYARAKFRERFGI